MKQRNRILVGVLALIVVGLTGLAIALSYNSPCETNAASPGAVAPRMKAVMYRCYGPPEILTVEEIAKPTPASDEVLVKVHAAALNPLDWHRLRGEPYFLRLGDGFGRPASDRLGVDFAGTVEAVGRDVSKFKPGDAVFGGRTGAFAEYIVVRDNSSVALKPANVSFDHAATVGIAGATALQALRDRGQLRAGQKVLINGASGGVGTFAVQMAKTMGAHVTGVCSTRNLELVRSLGADRVIDYTKDNFTAHDDQYDLIIDNVGTQSIPAIRRVLAPTGKLVIVGGVSRDPWIGPMIRPIQAALYSLFVDQELGMMMASMKQPDLEFIGELMSSGKVTPVIDRHYPLEDIAAALTYLETGRARGKVVIDVVATTSAITRR